MELTAALEAKEGKLTSLEEQIEQLQGHISRLESKSAEVSALYCTREILR